VTNLVVMRDVVDEVDLFRVMRDVVDEVDLFRACLRDRGDLSDRFFSRLPARRAFTFRMTVTASAMSSMPLIPVANPHNWQTLGVPRQA